MNAPLTLVLNMHMNTTFIFATSEYDYERMLAIKIMHIPIENSTHPPHDIRARGKIIRCRRKRVCTCLFESQGTAGPLFFSEFL